MRSLLFIVMVLIGLCGCATTNNAYKNLEKSPCACFKSIKKGELKNV